MCCKALFNIYIFTYFLAKEGKMGGYVDDEGGTLAPWMMPPEDQSHYSNRDQATQPSSSSSHYQVLRYVNTVSMCRYIYGDRCIFTCLCTYNICIEICRQMHIHSYT